MTATSSLDTLWSTRWFLDSGDERHDARTWESWHDEGRAYKRRHHSGAWIECGNCAHRVFAQKPCGYRICPRCARKDARRSARVLEGRIRGASRRLRRGERLSMLTLTTQLTPFGCLSDGIDQHIASVRRLMDRLGELVTWGQFHVEVTSQGAGWHVHSHGIIRAQYMQQSWLVDEWLESNWGTGIIVWISEIYGNDYSDAATEASKYPTKPLEMVKWSDHMLGEAVLALQGRKRVFSIGSIGSPDEPIDPWHPGCPKCQGPMREIERLGDLLTNFGQKGIT